MSFFTERRYYPALSINPSEISALGHLPGPDLDQLIPLITLRKWLNSGNLSNSFTQISAALDDRSLILDLGRTRDPPQGNAELELAALLDPAGGFGSWLALLETNENFIPVLQWADLANTQAEFEALGDLGRGMVLRFKRSRAWNLADLASMSPLDASGVSILCILDFGQIHAATDLTEAAAELVAVAEAIRQRVISDDLAFSLAASSFPVDFASINREHARIPIRERELFNLISAADVFASPDVSLIYGDYGSVFAAERGFAQAGAPRVDYPAPNRWTYYRREIDHSFVAAAQQVMADQDWDDELIIWGSNEIRRAAAGNIDGLHYQRAWTAVRIQLHLHQQLHFGTGGLYQNDDEWAD